MVLLPSVESRLRLCEGGIILRFSSSKTCAGTQSRKTFKPVTTLPAQAGSLTKAHTCCRHGQVLMENGAHVGIYPWCILECMAVITPFSLPAVSG